MIPNACTESLGWAVELLYNAVFVSVLHGKHQKNYVPTISGRIDYDAK
jgi:hypothetical protein